MLSVNRSLEYVLLDTLTRYINSRTLSTTELEKNPRANLLLVERENYLTSIITTSLPIVRVYGDWGQGKSTLGILLYKIAVTNNNSFYITYLPLAKIVAELGDEAQLTREALRRFYSSDGNFSDKDFDRLFRSLSPAPARNFMQLLAPLMFSPNHAKEVYNLENRGIILTNLPKSAELKPIEYLDKTPYEIAKNVVEKLGNKRYFICIDEIEGIRNIRIEPQFFGPLLELARLLYDFYGYNKVVFVYLIQETERPTFDAMIEEIRTQRSFARIYGIIGNPINVEKMNGDELKEYALLILRDILGSNADQLIDNKVLDHIIESASGASNTRIATSILRAELLRLLTNIILRHVEVKAIDINDIDALLNAAREVIKKKNIKITIEQYEKESIVASELREIFHGKYDKLNKYVEAMLKSIVEEVYNVLKNKINITPPSLRSRRPGYTSYQFLIKYVHQREEKNVRIILWLRLSRFYKIPTKERLLTYLGLGPENQTTKGTVKYINKILFLHAPTLRAALIQEMNPELIIPIEMSSDDIASALVKTNILGSYIAPDIKNTLQEHFMRNLIPKIVSILETSIKMR